MKLSRNVLAEALVREFGGPEQLARLIREEVEKTRPGSQERVSLLKQVISFVAKIMEREDEEEVPLEELKMVARLVEHAESTGARNGENATAKETSDSSKARCKRGLRRL